MLDASVRPLLDGPLRTAARLVDRPWITPNRISIAGLVLGLSSALTAGLQWWALALILWLTSRVCDGLDGPLARRRVSATADRGAPTHNSDAGGFLDITADFLVYGSTVLGVAIGVTRESAYDASWIPFAVVLLTYYVNGTAFLAFSSIAERTGHQLDDGRSFSFLGGLAEGTETIAVHSLWLMLPFYAEQIAWVWAVVVGISAAQRMIGGYLTLTR